MKSIKPGRGPSMMSGVSGIFMIGFGIVWTLIALQASPLFALFGVFWTGIAVVNTVYSFKNATGKNRYSSYDITDGNEEPDLFNERFGGQYEEPRLYDEQRQAGSGKSLFCPYCGAPVDGDYRFCNKCGRELP